MKALLTGGTGFIGRHLVERLDKPVVLTRSVEKARSILGEKAACAAWQPSKEPAPARAFEGVDVVLHLLGDSVGEGRWSSAKKKRIRDSRVLGTRNLVAGLRALASRPKVLVSASAVGFYGDRGDEPLDETSAPGGDFLAKVCVEWEAEARAAEELGMRVVCMRTGIALGGDGGALGKMALPFKLGAGGPVGSGKQWMPWIHIDDLVGLYLLAAQRSDLAGPVAGVAPEAVTNAQFSRTLGRVLRRPAFMPAPGFMLRIVIGEFTDALLSSQKVHPRMAHKAGYEFRYPALERALREIYGR